MNLKYILEEKSHIKTAPNINRYPDWVIGHTGMFASRDYLSLEYHLQIFAMHTCAKDPMIGHSDLSDTQSAGGVV